MSGGSIVCACGREWTLISGPGFPRCPICGHPWINAAKPYLERVLADFPDWLKSDRLASDNTAACYFSFVRATDRKLGDVHAADLLTCSAQQLRDVFLDGDPAAQKRISYAAALRAFYGFAALRGLRSDDPTIGLPRTRKPKSLPRPVEADVLESYLAAAERIGPREHAFAALGGLAGLRVSEAAGLEWSGVGRELRVTGKGGVTRHIPVSTRLAAILDAWRAVCPNARFVFPNGRGGPMGSHSIQGWHHTITAAAGLERFSYHRLRHSFASRALNASNGDLRAVQLLLGHSTPEVTAVYTRVGSDRLASIVEAM